MQLNKVVLAGGAGYIGSILANYYSNKAKEVIILSRGADKQVGSVRTIHWNGSSLGPWMSELESTDLLINLTGKNVNCRYTQKNKSEILRSRLDATNALGEAIAHLAHPPRVWVQVASATIYRHAQDRPMDEVYGEIGSGFSVDVCTQWEKTFWQQHTPTVRKVLLRTSIVLGNNGGAFPRLKNLVRCGLGGKQGNGRQYISWIHEDDVAGIINWAYNRSTLTGTFNCTAPGPIQNSEFMKLLQSAYKKWLALPAPAWLLAIGAALIGTETELILKSRWVMPVKLLKAGYPFKFPNATVAINDLIQHNTQDTTRR